jgi:hypothetical protein
VVFDAYGTPTSRPLGRLLADLRGRHAGALRIAWRHYPDSVAHPRTPLLALAAEAGAQRGSFWALTPFPAVRQAGRRHRRHGRRAGASVVPCMVAEGRASVVGRRADL